MAMGSPPLHEQVSFFYARIIFVDLFLFSELKVVDPALRGRASDLLVKLLFHSRFFPDELFRIISLFASVVNSHEVVKRQEHEPAVGALGIERAQLFLIDVRRRLDTLLEKMLLILLQVFCAQTARKQEWEDY